MCARVADFIMLAWSGLLDSELRIRVLFGYDYIPRNACALCSANPGPWSPIYKFLYPTAPPHIFPAHLQSPQHYIGLVLYELERTTENTTVSFEFSRLTALVHKALSVDGIRAKSDITSSFLLLSDATLARI